jgi:membrane-associated protein
MRFFPIIRIFVAFVAGIGSMTYPRFMIYNLTGAILWVLLFTLGGYFVGNIPFVRQNFSLVIVALVLIPGIQATIEFVRHSVSRSRKCGLL